MFSKFPGAIAWLTQGCRVGVERGQRFCGGIRVRFL